MNRDPQDPFNTEGVSATPPAEPGIIKEESEERTHEGIDSRNDTEYQRLDPFAVKLWTLDNLISWGVLLLIAMVAGGSLWIFTPFPRWVALLIWTTIAALLLFTTIWIPRLKYARWSYLLDERILELRHGIVWRTSAMIPLSRLQHVDLNRGPFERRFGLGTLVVHTAGTHHASHEIPYLGIETALSLRERLIEAADLDVE